MTIAAVIYAALILALATRDIVDLGTIRTRLDQCSPTRFHRRGDIPVKESSMGLGQEAPIGADLNHFQERTTRRATKDAANFYPSVSNLCSVKNV
jgi:hypothetical protein